MKLYKQLPKPRKTPIEGFFTADKLYMEWWQGESLKEELYGPAIISANSIGMKIRGHEPDGVDKTGRGKFKYQEWWIVYGG